MNNTDNNIVLACGLSRGVVVSLLYPIDTIKSRLQNATAIQSSLYRGFVYTTSTQIVYGMLVFGTYENLKKHKYKNNIMYNIKNAIVSDLIGSIFLCPCEVIKQNIQVGRYNSVTQACKHINGLRGFYRGYLGLICRDLPFRAIQLPLYEEVKKLEYNNAIAGCIAGMTAAAITNPIDVIKTQLMCNTNKNIQSTVKNIYRQRGLYSFFSGMLYRMFYLGASSTVFFYSFEKMKQCVIL